MSDSISGAQPGTRVKLVSKNQAATTPEFVCELPIRAADKGGLRVVAGLLSAGSVMGSQGTSTMGFCTAEALRPPRADFARLKLDSQKHSPALGQQGHSQLYRFPYL